MPKPIPDGYQTVTPVLTIKGAREALDFYERALGAQVRFKMDTPDGRVAHAEIQIGDSVIMVGEEDPGRDCYGPDLEKGSPAGLFLYVKDADAAFDQAVDAGAEEEKPVANMFWGDRMGTVRDPFGYNWSFATHVEDLTEKEIAERAAKMFSQPQPAGKT